ncbi:inositol polyphosphate 1-phosphatase [Camarhynchus parvulus]|uniref:inositol polyphosphate 1-phosphatase n=1 Tax=Geospiza parvula TaxID=87175 RepID=UPI00123802B9|nr:inositol polyphosphate 1-phosphatase [Camarhynchus parvulus]
MAGLLPALVAVSQKAAEVARRCRAEEPLFRLLVAEKSGPERSARFERDFKTLADVLIQELIKHDLGTQFPELRGHIHGEESSEFRDAHGGMVTVRVGATPEDTVALLVAVLGPEHTRAAELLAEAVHQEVTLGDTELDGIDPGLSPGELGIWIDPIDSTNEFIGGREDVAAVDGVAPGGLRSALVLVGAFDRRSGVPVLGVINEPFFQRDPQSHRWQGRYHWGVAHGATRLCSLSPPVPRARPRVVLSRAESAAVRGALASLGGGPPLFAAGAGYKLLCVALGLADAFVLSQATTFAWDSCAPHAVLRALGGGVVALAGALRAGGGTGDPPELRYHRPGAGGSGPERWANREGLVAFVHPPVLRAVLGALGALGDGGGERDRERVGNGPGTTGNGTGTRTGTTGTGGEMAPGPGGSEGETAPGPAGVGGSVTRDHREPEGEQPRERGRGRTAPGTPGAPGAGHEAEPEPGPGLGRERYREHREHRERYRDHRAGLERYRSRYR